MTCIFHETSEIIHILAPTNLELKHGAWNIRQNQSHICFVLKGTPAVPNQSSLAKQSKPFPFNYSSRFTSLQEPQSTSQEAIWIVHSSSAIKKVLIIERSQNKWPDFFSQLVIKAAKKDAVGICWLRHLMQHRGGHLVTHPMSGTWFIPWLPCFQSGFLLTHRIAAGYNCHPHDPHVADIWSINPKMKDTSPYICLHLCLSNKNKK